MTLGQAIKLVRTSAGIKQHKLADKLGVSSNYISLIECGKREPSVPLLRNLARALEVPVGIFFLWQDLDPKSISQKNLNQLRRLVLQMETIFLASSRKRTYRSTATS